MQKIKTFQVHNRSVQDIVILNDETNLIATSLCDKTIKIWKISLSIATFTDHIDYVYSLEYLPKDNLFIGCSRDTTIKF